jgi:hypothetical protein
VVASGVVELADFELGKMLHSWDGGAVHWARQRSLDRAVLVWRDGMPSADGALPGVFVRHPAVLGLHAVFSPPEGRVLVTEPVAASPLPEVLHQHPLTAREAVLLTARLAEAVQAFHEQGACHGRLRPEWVLVRGDLEPVLCPCGVPSQSPEDRAADVRALGKLLEGWLPPRPRLWRYEMLAPVYRACDAAVAGQYERAADLAADLHRASRAAAFRWRERWATVLTCIVLLVPCLLLGLGRLASPPGGSSVDGALFLTASLMALVGAALLFGYTQVRSLVQRARLCTSRRDLIFPGTIYRRPVQTGLFLAVATALGAAALVGFHGPAPLTATVPAILVILVTFLLCGAGVAAIITFGELLARSLRRARGIAVEKPNAE